MGIDKHNSLQFLSFLKSIYFEEFGDRDGVYLHKVPFELRPRLYRWTWPTTAHDHYFFVHEGRDVITREGWEEFIRWVGQALDEKYLMESLIQDRKTELAMQDRRDDETMAEMYRKNPADALQFLRSVLAAGGVSELSIAIKRMARAFD